LNRFIIRYAGAKVLRDFKKIIKIIKQRLTGWGRYPQIEANIAQPDLMIELPSQKDFKYLTSRGMGRSYGDASLGNSDSLVIQTAYQNKIHFFNRIEGVIKAQAGILLEDILNVIIPSGWFLPVTPGTRFVSLGGVVACNVHGKNHHKAGGIVNFIESLEVLTENGLKQCSANNSADLFYATVGGYGLTGIIQGVTLKLKPIETAYISVRTVKVNNYIEALEVNKKLDQDYEYSLT